MKHTAFNPIFAAALAITVLVASANGAVVLAPTSASTNMGEALSYTTVDHAINQNELSIGYTSLVTDFDTYIASGPLAGGGNNYWASTFGVRNGNFDFALGGTYLVSGMVIWNMYSDPSAIQNFNLLLDDNAAFSSPVTFNNLTASRSLGSGFGSGSSAADEVFNFAETSASFVRLEILDTYSSSSNFATFREAAFAVSTPEPTIPAFCSVSLACIALRRRRAKSNE